MSPPLPLCSYWDRQEFRGIDDRGFGFTPQLTTAEWETREREDRNDPPCDDCAACREQANGVDPRDIEASDAHASTMENAVEHRADLRGF